MKEESLKTEVSEVLKLEKSLAEREAALMANEQFRDFLTYQKETTARIADFWKKVEAEMIKHDIKAIKGEWGSLTVAEKLSWKCSDKLPDEYYKKVPDTKKLSNTYRLEGSPPKVQNLQRHAI